MKYFKGKDQNLELVSLVCGHLMLAANERLDRLVVVSVAEETHHRCCDICKCCVSVFFQVEWLYHY